MAGVLIENGGYLREILRLLGAERWDCNWLITELECYDYCGWEGCEKWAEETLFLSNREFLHDVELRNMQFVWGILSAVPASYKKEQVMSSPLPAFSGDENGESCYLADTLCPQHPLAFLEIMCEDSTSVTVIARDMVPLRPLFRLSERTEDAEKNNRRWHEAMEKGRALLEAHGLSRWEYRTCPGIPQKVRNDRIAEIWWSLYRHQPDRPIREDDIRTEVLRILEREKESHHG